MMKKILVMSILGGSLLISTQVLAADNGVSLATACRDNAKAMGLTGSNGYGQYMKECVASSGPGVTKGGKPSKDTSDPFQEL